MGLVIKKKKGNVWVGIDQIYSLKNQRYLGVVMTEKDVYEKSFKTEQEASIFINKEFKKLTSIKKQSIMSTKKPSAKQLAARKKFAAMAKSGELAKKRKTATKKKTGLKKPVTKGLTTLCAKTVGVEGRRKKDGTVKKKHVVKKGGKVVATKKKVVKK